VGCAAVSKPEIILVGGGGHCRSCIDVIEQEDLFRIAGVVERSGADENSNLLGYPILGSDDDLPQLRKSFDNALVSIGQIRTPDIRIRLFNLLQEINFVLPVIISPLAYVSKHARVGKGSIIMHHALINAGAEVGFNCIINTKALIEHDAMVENHSHVATAAVINGGSSIGKGSFVGSNASMVQETKVSDGFFARAMSLITGKSSV